MQTLVLTTFLKKNPRKRINGYLLPVSLKRQPVLIGWPPNLMHDTDLYQSLLPYLSGLHFDGITYAVSGKRLEETFSAAGHTHEEDPLSWKQIFSFTQTSDRLSKREAHTIESTDRALFCVGVCRIPDGIEEVYPKAKVTVPIGVAPTFFYILLEAYGDLDTSFSAPIKRMILFDCRNGKVFTEQWVEGTRILVSELSLSGERLLLFRWSWAMSFTAGNPNAAIWEVALGGR